MTVQYEKCRNKLYCPQDDDDISNLNRTRCTIRIQNPLSKWLNNCVPNLTHCDDPRSAHLPRPPHNTWPRFLRHPPLGEKCVLCFCNLVVIARARLSSHRTHLRLVNPLEKTMHRVIMALHAFWVIKRMLAQRKRVALSEDAPLDLSSHSNSLSDLCLSHNSNVFVYLEVGA